MGRDYEDCVGLRPTGAVSFGVGERLVRGGLCCVDSFLGLSSGAVLLQRFIRNRSFRDFQCFVV